MKTRTALARAAAAILATTIVVPMLRAAQIQTMWTGGAGTSSWTALGNWSGGTVPTATGGDTFVVKIDLAPGTASSVSLSAAAGAIIDALQIDPGDQLTLSDGTTLTLGRVGDVAFVGSIANAGTLIIGDGTTGATLSIASTITLSGAGTVQLNDGALIDGDGELINQSAIDLTNSGLTPVSATIGSATLKLTNSGTIGVESTGGEAAVLTLRNTPGEAGALATVNTASSRRELAARSSSRASTIHSAMRRPCRIPAASCARPASAQSWFWQAKRAFPAATSSARMAASSRWSIRQISSASRSRPSG